MPYRKHYFAINQQQHRQQLSDFYIPVLFEYKYLATICAPIPHSAVSTWQLRIGHSPYHSVPASLLTQEQIGGWR
jgi:hypothetical protein